MKGKGENYKLYMTSNLVFELNKQKLKFVNWDFLGKFCQINSILGLTYYKSDYIYTMQKMLQRQKQDITGSTM